MRIITFITKEMYDQLINTGYCTWGHVGNEKPIWSYHLNENTIPTLIALKTPLEAQVMLVLDVDPGAYTDLDYVKWMNTYLQGCTEVYSDSLRPDENSKYIIAALETIRSKWILDAICISDSTDSDELLDKLLDMHIDVLEKPSGYTWHHISEDASKDNVRNMNELTQAVTAIATASLLTNGILDDYVEKINHCYRGDKL